MTTHPRIDPLDQLRADTLAKIGQHGYTMIVVGSGECAVPGCTCSPEPYPYAYSLGLVDLGHPELVTFGVPLTHVNALARPVFEAVAAGRPLAVGREHRHELDDAPSISLVPVPDLWVQRDPGRVGGWFDIYSTPDAGIPSFVQVCWSDATGAMPWERGCDRRVAELQPVLEDDPVRYPSPPRNSSRHRRRR